MAILAQNSNLRLEIQEGEKKSISHLDLTVAEIDDIRDAATNLKVDLTGWGVAGGGPKLVIFEKDGTSFLKAKAIGGWLCISFPSTGRHLDLTITPTFLRHLSEETPSSARIHRAMNRILIQSMIGTSYYHLLDDLMDGMEETSGGFVDLLAMLYGVHLQNSMSIGVPRAYVEEQMLGTTIRGTILTHRLVPGIWIHPHKIEQRVTEYVEDHLLNQFLRWGGEHLLRMASSPHAIDALESGLAYLSSVRAIPPPLSWVETFELSRVDDHVELLFGLAKLVYKMSGVALLDDNEAETTKSTEELVPSLVFSTWNVFENYCYSITRDAVSEIDQSLKVTYDARSKVTLAERVGDGRRLVHQPDIVVRSAEDGTIVPFVFDAKYSDRAFGRVPDPDARNQVLVAANDLQSPHAILMMPPYGGMDGERRRITWDLKSKEQWSTNTISVIYTNPLSESDPDAREKEVRWLAEELVAVQQT